MEDIFRKLVGFHTVTDDHQSVHEALDYIATFVATRGMHVARYESNGYESLVATITPDNKTPKVMLAAHLDVTPAPDEAFDIRQDGDKLYGRGTLDMKFAIAAYLQLVDELQGSLQDYDFGIMITTDEEEGGNDGINKLIQEGYLPQVCLLPDGGDNWQIQLSSKGFYYLQLVAYGTTAHGSRPWLGVNAIQSVLNALQDVQAIFAPSGPEVATLNIGKIEGGGAINQVADFAQTFLDIRTVTEAEKAPLIGKIQAACDKHHVELTVLLNGAATRFSLEDPLIAPFARHITEVTGITVTGSHTLGSNDTRYFAPHNIPCISVYPAGGGHHGPEEWISQQGLHQFKEVLGLYLDEVARP